MPFSHLCNKVIQLKIGRSQNIGVAEVAKPKKEDFAKEFILTGCKNGTLAAVNAGYSEKTAAQAASRLLKDVKVLAMIDEYKKASTKKFIWTKEEKLIKIEKLIDCAMKSDPEKGMINMAAAIAGFKEHNLMQGDNAPTQTENLHRVVDDSELDW